MSVQCKHVEDNSGFRYCIQKNNQQNLLEKGIDIMRGKERKGKIDRQIQEDISSSSALFI